MEWKIVPETDELLWIREDGLPYRESFLNGRDIRIPSGYPSCCQANTGYVVFRAFNQLFQVHRCVGSAFVEGMTEDRRYINHKDGDKTNNHYSNLEWVTGLENMEHGINTGLIPHYDDRNYTRGNEHYSSKIPEKGVEWILANFSLPKKEQVRQVDVARMFGVTPSAIHNIRNGRSWHWKKDKGNT